MFDTKSYLGASAVARLSDEIVIWLTTVDPSGTPQPTPVWFLWTGTDVVIFSQPDKAKLRNIKANPGVALNFDGNKKGGDIVVFPGRATVGEDVSEKELAAFDEKYAADIERLRMTTASLHADYSVPIRVTPTKVRSG